MLPELGEVNLLPRREGSHAEPRERTISLLVCTGDRGNRRLQALAETEDGSVPACKRVSDPNIWAVY